MKPLKAWMVVATLPRFSPTAWGNGCEFQYPIFPTRTETRNWKSRIEADNPGIGRGFRVIPVEIRERKPKGGKRNAE